MTAKKILKSEVPSRKTPLTKMAATKKIATNNTTKSVLKTRVARISIVNSGKVSAVTLQKLETIAQVRHFKFKEDKPVRFDPKKIDAELFKRSANAPKNIEFSMEPTEDDTAGCHLSFFLT